MYMTFRWYGKDDPVKIDYIRQIPGMKGIVSAIYDIPVGEVWPLDRILELKKEVEDAGLELSVIESVLANGATFLQLREKNATHEEIVKKAMAIKPIAKKYGSTAL